MSTVAISPRAVQRLRPAPAADAAAFTLFRPHLFFYRPWKGEGEMLGPKGERLAGFTVSGDGRASSRLGRIVQNWAFDTGLAYVTEWKVLSTDGRDYRAIEARSGWLARGHQVGDAFVWVIRAKGPTPFGQRRVKITTVYRMVAPGVAEAKTTTTLWGLFTLGRMNATYRRLEA
jgi:hypothetical protein